MTYLVKFINLESKNTRVLEECIQYKNVMITFTSTLCIRKTPGRTQLVKVNLFKGIVGYYFLFPVSHTLPVSYSKSTINATLHMLYYFRLLKLSLHPPPTFCLVHCTPNKHNNFSDLLCSTYYLLSTHLLAVIFIKNRCQLLEVGFPQVSS